MAVGTAKWNQSNSHQNPSARSKHESMLLLESCGKVYSWSNYT